MIALKKVWETVIGGKTGRKPLFAKKEKEKVSPVQLLVKTAVKS
jgi:hypothetical protein